MIDQNAGTGTILFGGSGFLGPYILEKNPAMISVGRTPPRTANRHIHVDTLDDLSVLRNVHFENVIYIIGNTDHYNLEKEALAPHEHNAFDYHVAPFLRVMEQLKHYPIKKFIHFSTVLIYDADKVTLPVSECAPIDPYRNRYVLSKYMAEEASKFYARWIPIITVRLANLYGPTQLTRFDLIHVICRKLLAEGKAEIWSDKPSRDFIYVEDAADAIVRLLDTGYTGTLNLGTGVMTSVRRIIDLLEEISGCPIVVRNEAVQGPMQFQCDMTTLNRLIDWMPRMTIEDGVRRTYQMMQSWRIQ
jgi:nucleoside-diphosphate-sugar epimerase